jgi:hypothetical protein
MIATEWIAPEGAAWLPRPSGELERQSGGLLSYIVAHQLALCRSNTGIDS